MTHRIFIAIILTISFYNISAQNLSDFYGNLYTQKPLLDVNLNIEAFSYKDYLKFLTKILDSDQIYRKKLVNIDQKKDSLEWKHSIRTMKQNDRANQIILLKLIKKFGWPCSTNLNYSFIAWTVVWHSEIFYRQDFSIYMKKALDNDCILRQHYEQFKFDK